MADKETPGEKRTNKQRALEAKNLDAEQLYKKGSLRFNYPGKIADALMGESDYGTELSPGAESARQRTTKEKFPNLPYKRDGYKETDADVLRAGREAAAEERREARGMKKGGKVASASKRADGIASKGKTRGTIVMCGGGIYKK